MGRRGLLNYLGQVFDEMSGASIGVMFDLTNFVIATAGGQSSSNLGNNFNNAVGFGYSLLMTIITNTDVGD